MAVADGYVSGGLRRGRGKEKVRKKQQKGRRRRRSLHGRSVFSQPGGAEQPTVGSDEAANRPRGTHGFGVAGPAAPLHVRSRPVVFHVRLGLFRCVRHTRFLTDT